jgi:hypothetical protein
MEKDERGPRRKVTGGAGFVTASDQAPSQADRQERPTSADTTASEVAATLRLALAEASFVRQASQRVVVAGGPTIDADFRRGWRLLGPRTDQVAHAFRYHPAP